MWHLFHNGNGKGCECMKYVRLKDKIKQEAKDLAAKVERTGEYPIAYIVGEDELTVKVLCPYCQQIHIHGKAGEDPEGSRAPHCWELKEMPDYIVKWPVSKAKSS